MRINKYIAKSGYCSRRKADNLIEKGQVKVNGIVLDKPGYEVCEDDLVSINGEILKLEEFFYYKLNKPIGYITSNYDPHNPRDLNDLIDLDSKFFAAGRLDKDSHGLLIITNDGDFANGLTHPSNCISKEYIVKVDKKLSAENIKKFESGLDIGNGEITTKSLIFFKGDNTYQVVISQGFNRQIRRMFKELGSNVIDLERIRIGAIHLDELKSSDYKKFSKKELEFVDLIKG